MRAGQALGRIGAWMLMAAMPCAAFALLKVTLWQWHNWPLVWDVDDALALVAAAVGAVVASYLTVSAVAMVAAAAMRKGRTIPARARALAPAAWQRVAAVALGVGLSSGIAMPAMASAQAPPGLGWADAPVATEQEADAAVSDVYVDNAATVNVRLDWGGVGSPVENVPATPHTNAVASAPDEDVIAPPPPSAPGTYVVEPGDSLWAITSNLLGADATRAEIESSWPVLYEANRSLIGDNPSLIFAGTELHVPAELAR